MPQVKPRVLLIVEAANPEWVSVPLEGWSLGRALSRLADVHLVTQVRNQDAFIRNGLVEGKDFTSIDSELVARKSWRLSSILRGGKGKGWTSVQAMSPVSYYYFERLLWEKFKHKISNREFDIVHRLTPISPTIPTLLAGKCKRKGTKFILGPLNGGLPWPEGFNSVRIQEREWLSYIRFFHKILPGYTQARNDASAIIVGSLATWNQMPSRYHHKCVYIAENAVDEKHFFSTHLRRSKHPIKGIFVGRLTPYKGVDMLIEAVAHFVKRGDITLDIVGDGPQRSQLKKIVAKLHIENGIKFTGWLKHEKVQAKISDSDIFIFPSIREFGGAVVLEAMSVGLVPIVMDYGGPAELVTPDTGFLIKMGNRTEIINRLKKTLGYLIDNPLKIDIKRKCAIRRVKEYFTWDKKSKQVLEVYNWVLSKRENKPEFGMPFPDKA